MKISISNIIGVLRVVIYKIRYGKKMKIDFSQSKKLVYMGKGCKIKIGKDSYLRISGGNYFDDYTYLSVQDGGTCIIEKDVYFNTFSKIYCINSIDIRNGCIFGSNTAIYDHNHNIVQNIPISKSGMKKAKVVIEENVWIGTNSVVLMDTFIKSGNVIGANTVVSKKLNVRGIYCGMPAKLIKEIK